MIITTTNTVEGHNITAYKGVVTGEAIIGANIFRDIFAGITDIIGGRSGAYEKSLREAREIAFSELESEARAMGANAIVGVDIDYENISAGGKSSLLMVSATGTAVILD